MDPKEKEFFLKFLIGGGLLFLILVGYVVSTVVQYRRYRRLLRAKLNAEILTLEQERKRMATDLHDEVGPMLSAIKMQVNHMNEGLPEAERSNLKVSQHIDDTIQRMREISNDLLPTVLLRKGLDAAIKNFLEKFRGSVPMEIQYDSLVERRAGETVEVNMFRIVQEIVHNTVKHSGAEKMRMQLIITRDQLRLATEDNGRGFDFEKLLNSSSGLGLKSLQSRAELLNGEMTVNSNKEKGTRYLFEIPLGAQEDAATT